MMNRSDKTPKKSEDKNTRRIEKQTETQNRVKKATESKSHPSLQEGPLGQASAHNNNFQSGSPSRPMFSVDPELERQMAAQGVDQQAKDPKKSNRRTPSQKSPAGKKRKSSAPERQTGKPSKDLPNTGAWEDKGDPKFASPDDQRPGPL